MKELDITLPAPYFCNIFLPHKILLTQSSCYSSILSYIIRVLEVPLGSSTTQTLIITLLFSNINIYIVYHTIPCNSAFIYMNVNYFSLHRRCLDGCFFYQHIEFSIVYTTVDSQLIVLKV